MTYTIITEAEMHADDMLVGTFRAAISFGWVEASGDGWHEPREDAHAKFHSVRQVGGDWLDKAGLTEWAQEWLAQINDDLEYLMSRDRSTWDERVEAQRAMYARQSAMMPVRLAAPIVQAVEA